MDSSETDGYIPTFYIGHHDDKRVRVDAELLQLALDSNVSVLDLPCLRSVLTVSLVRHAHDALDDSSIS